MKITLVYTGIFEGNNVVPPLGILYLAAVLENKGHSVQVFDVDPDVENYRDQIRQFDPDCIGIGFLTPAYPRALRLAKDLRSRHPGALSVSVDRMRPQSRNAYLRRLMPIV